MIQPVDFPERNAFLFLPELMVVGKQLPTHLDGKHVITCWQFDEQELQALAANGGRFYLVQVINGGPKPLFMQVESPFIPQTTISPSDIVPMVRQPTFQPQEAGAT